MGRRDRRPTPRSSWARSRSSARRARAAARLPAHPRRSSTTSARSRSSASSTPSRSTRSRCGRGRVPGRRSRCSAASACGGPRSTSSSALVLWVATVESGVHPTIAGVAAGCSSPPTRRAARRSSEAAALFRAFRQSPPPSVGTLGAAEPRARRLAQRAPAAMLHPWTSYVIVPLFALANAGVDLRGGTLGDALPRRRPGASSLGLVVGKLVGIGVAAAGRRAARAGLAAAGRRRRRQSLGGGRAVGHRLHGLAVHRRPRVRRPGARRTRRSVGVLAAPCSRSLLGWVDLLARGAAPRRADRRAAAVLDAPSTRRATTSAAGPTRRSPSSSTATSSARSAAARPGRRRELRAPLRRRPALRLPPPPARGRPPARRLAAQAAEAAGAQGAFWEMHDQLFAHQDRLEFEDLLGLRGRARARRRALRRRLRRRAPRGARRARDVGAPRRSGARGTPTFFVGDRRHVGPYDAGRSPPS